MRKPRVTAVLTAVIFLLTNTGWANPVTESLPAAVPIKFKTEDFRIPENLGTVQELYHPEAQNSEKPFIVFIQDAHAILNAQQNIHRLIEYLQEKYGIHLVALEGGSGKLDPTLLKTFPDEIVKNKIMNSYLERGEVTGPEMAAIFGQSQGEYYGIENWGLYEENYAAYLKASGVKEELLENLNQIKTSLDQERKKVYSAKLSDFHNQTTSFHEERSHLVELLKYLSAMLKSEIASVVSLPRNDNSAFTEKRANNNSTVIARRPKADEAISEKYPHLALLLESVAAEDSMKEESLDASIRHMASALKAKMSGKLNMNDEMAFHKNYQAFVTGQMEPGMYLKFLMETGEKLKLKPKLTPLMMKLLGLQQTLSMIKGTKVFDELEAFILDLENGLITTPEERQIADQYRKLGLLKDLISLEATREQVAAYQKNPEDYNAVTKESRHSEPQQVLQRGEESLQAALNYYRIALERDGAFHQNLENLLKRRKAGAAIVLAGGFHSEGFEKELKEKGYPHAVIMPRIQSLAGRETYPELMQGKISYKDFLETTFYDAFARHSTLQLVGEWNEPDFRRNLKTWRDEIIRGLSKEGRIAEAGRYTRYVDILAKTYYEKYGTKVKNSASMEEIRKVIEEQINHYRDKTVSGLWRKFQRQLAGVAVPSALIHMGPANLIPEQGPLANSELRHIFYGEDSDLLLATEYSAMLTGAAAKLSQSEQRLAAQLAQTVSVKQAASLIETTQRTAAQSEARSKSVTDIARSLEGFSSRLADETGLPSNPAARQKIVMGALDIALNQNSAQKNAANSEVRSSPTAPKPLKLPIGRYKNVGHALQPSLASGIVSVKTLTNSLITQLGLKQRLLAEKTVKAPDGQVSMVVNTLADAVDYAVQEVTKNWVHASADVNQDNPLIYQAETDPVTGDLTILLTDPGPGFNFAEAGQYKTSSLAREGLFAGEGVGFYNLVGLFEQLGIGELKVKTGGKETTVRKGSRTENDAPGSKGTAITLTIPLSQFVSSEMRTAVIQPEPFNQNFSFITVDLARKSDEKRSIRYRSAQAYRPEELANKIALVTTGVGNLTYEDLFDIHGFYISGSLDLIFVQEGLGPQEQRRVETHERAHSSFDYRWQKMPADQQREFLNEVLIPVIRMAGWRLFNNILFIYGLKLARIKEMPEGLPRAYTDLIGSKTVEVSMTSNGQLPDDKMINFFGEITDLIEKQAGAEPGFRFNHNLLDEMYAQLSENSRGRAAKSLVDDAFRSRRIVDERYSLVPVETEPAQQTQSEMRKLQAIEDEMTEAGYENLQEMVQTTLARNEEIGRGSSSKVFFIKTKAGDKNLEEYALRVPLDMSKTTASVSDFTAVPHRLSINVGQVVAKAVSPDGPIEIVRFQPGVDAGGSFRYSQLSGDEREQVRKETIQEYAIYLKSAAAMSEEAYGSLAENFKAVMDASYLVDSSKAANLRMDVKRQRFGFVDLIDIGRDSFRNPSFDPLRILLDGKFLNNNSETDTEENLKNLREIARKWIRAALDSKLSFGTDVDFINVVEGILDTLKIRAVKEQTVTAALGLIKDAAAMEQFYRDILNGPELSAAHSEMRDREDNLKDSLVENVGKNLATEEIYVLDPGAIQRIAAKSEMRQGTSPTTARSETPAMKDRIKDFANYTRDAIAASVKMFNKKQRGMQPTFTAPQAAFLLESNLFSTARDFGKNFQKGLADGLEKLDLVTQFGSDVRQNYADALQNQIKIRTLISGLVRDYFEKNFGIKIEGLDEQIEITRWGSSITLFGLSLVDTSYSLVDGRFSVGALRYTGQKIQVLTQLLVRYLRGSLEKEGDARDTRKIEDYYAEVDIDFIAEIQRLKSEFEQAGRQDVLAASKSYSAGMRRALEDYFRRKGLENDVVIYVGGSYALGLATPNSDMDVFLLIDDRLAKQKKQIWHDFNRTLTQVSLLDVGVMPTDNPRMATSSIVTQAELKTYLGRLKSEISKPDIAYNMSAPFFVRPVGNSNNTLRAKTDVRREFSDFFNSSFIQNQILDFDKAQFQGRDRINDPVSMEEALAMARNVRTNALGQNPAKSSRFGSRNIRSILSLLRVMYQQSAAAQAVEAANREDEIWASDDPLAEWLKEFSRLRINGGPVLEAQDFTDLMDAQAAILRIRAGFIEDAEQTAPEILRHMQNLQRISIRMNKILSAASSEMRTETSPITARSGLRNLNRDLSDTVDGNSSIDPETKKRILALLKKDEDTAKTWPEKPDSLKELAEDMGGEKVLLGLSRNPGILEKLLEDRLNLLTWPQKRAVYNRRKAVVSEFLSRITNASIENQNKITGSLIQNAKEDLMRFSKSSGYVGQKDWSDSSIEQAEDEMVKLSIDILILRLQREPRLFDHGTAIHLAHFILAATNVRRSGEGDKSAANSDLHFYTRLLSSETMGIPAVLLGVMAHELGHNIADYKGFRDQNIAEKTRHEFLADLEANAFYQDLQPELEMMDQFQKALDYNKHVELALEGWEEEHVLARIHIHHLMERINREQKRRKRWGLAPLRVNWQEILNHAYEVLSREKNMDRAVQVIFNKLTESSKGFDSVGKCVTGDTLLPITAPAPDISKGGPEQAAIRLVPILQVKTGDEVLSLNEVTGQIEPHRIKGLVDMGVKPVYRLTTASGRSIRTTANHPYLLKGQEARSEGQGNWIKVSELKAGNEIAVSNQENLRPTAHAIRLNDEELALKTSLRFPMKKIERTSKDHLFGHPFDVNQNDAVRFSDIKTNDIAKIVIERKENPPLCLREFKNFFIGGPAEFFLSGRSNIEARFPESFNKIAMNTKVGQDSHHRRFILRGNSCGMFTKLSRKFNSGHNVLLGNSGILSGNLGCGITGRQKIQNISNGNAGSTHAGFSKTDTGVNRNAFVEKELGFHHDLQDKKYHISQRLSSLPAVPSKIGGKKRNHDPEPRSMVSAKEKSSSRNRRAGIDNDVVFLGQRAGVFKGGLDMLGRQRGEGLTDSFDRFSGRKQFQNLPDHNPRAFESRLSVANLRIGDNVRIDKNSRHDFSPLMGEIYHIAGRLSDWLLKPAYALPDNPPVNARGSESDILWDRIVSIEPAGRAHVYDIEVEGTHNFIGNGIFAHNTAIFGTPQAPGIETGMGAGMGKPEPITGFSQRARSENRSTKEAAEVMAEMELFGLEKFAPYVELKNIITDPNYYSAAGMPVFIEHGRKLIAEELRLRRSKSARLQRAIGMLGRNFSKGQKMLEDYDLQINGDLDTNRLPDEQGKPSGPLNRMGYQFFAKQQMQAKDENDRMKAEKELDEIMKRITEFYAWNPETRRRMARISQKKYSDLEAEAVKLEIEHLKRELANAQLEESAVPVNSGELLPGEREQLEARKKDLDRAAGIFDEELNRLEEARQNLIAGNLKLGAKDRHDYFDVDLTKNRIDILEDKIDKLQQQWFTGRQIKNLTQILENLKKILENERAIVRLKFLKLKSVEMPAFLFGYPFMLEEVRVQIEAEPVIEWNTKYRLINALASVQRIDAADQVSYPRWEGDLQKLVNRSENRSQYDRQGYFKPLIEPVTMVPGQNIYTELTDKGLVDEISRNLAQLRVELNKPNNDFIVQKYATLLKLNFEMFRTRENNDAQTIEDVEIYRQDFENAMRQYGLTNFAREYFPDRLRDTEGRMEGLEGELSAARSSLKTADQNQRGGISEQISQLQAQFEQAYQAHQAFYEWLAAEMANREMSPATNSEMRSIATSPTLPLSQMQNALEKLDSMARTVSERLKDRLENHKREIEREQQEVRNQIQQQQAVITNENSRSLLGQWWNESARIIQKANYETALLTQRLERLSENEKMNIENLEHLVKYELFNSIYRESNQFWENIVDFYQSHRSDAERFNEQRKNLGGFPLTIYRNIYENAMRVLSIQTFETMFSETETIVSMLEGEGYSKTQAEAVVDIFRNQLLGMISFLRNRIEWDHDLRPHHIRLARELPVFAESTLDVLEAMTLMETRRHVSNLYDRSKTSWGGSLGTMLRMSLEKIEYVPTLTDESGKQVLPGPFPEDTNQAIMRIGGLKSINDLSAAELAAYFDMEKVGSSRLFTFDHLKPAVKEWFLLSYLMYVQLDSQSFEKRDEANRTNRTFASTHQTGSFSGALIFGTPLLVAGEIQGGTNVLQGILEYGNLPKEFRGPRHEVDPNFPGQVDLGELGVKPSGNTLQEMMDVSVSEVIYGARGPLKEAGAIWLVYDPKDLASAGYPVSEAPAVSPNRDHRLAFVGIPSTQIRAIILNAPRTIIDFSGTPYDKHSVLGEVKRSIFEQGFYIPVYDREGNLIFSEEEYDRAVQESSVSPVETLRNKIRVTSEQAQRIRLLAQQSSEEFRPEILISELKKISFVGEQYEKSTGVSEGYRLDEHTAAVSRQFERFVSQQFNANERLEGVTLELMRMILALHDVGKPAVRSGEEFLYSEHQYTSDIIRVFMGALGYSPEQINIAAALVSGDPIGNYLKNNNLENSTEEFEELFSQSGLAGAMRPHFFELLTLYYFSDASAYTENAYFVTDQDDARAVEVEGEKRVYSKRSALSDVFDFAGPNMTLKSGAAAKVQSLKTEILSKSEMRLNFAPEIIDKVRQNFRTSKPAVYFHGTTMNTLSGLARTKGHLISSQEAMRQGLPIFAGETAQGVGMSQRNAVSATPSFSGAVHYAKLEHIFDKEEIRKMRDEALAKLKSLDAVYQADELQLTAQRVEQLDYAYKLLENLNANDIEELKKGDVPIVIGMSRAILPQIRHLQVNNFEAQEALGSRTYNDQMISATGRPLGLYPELDYQGRNELLMEKTVPLDFIVDFYVDSDESRQKVEAFLAAMNHSQIRVRTFEEGLLEGEVISSVKTALLNSVFHHGDVDGPQMYLAHNILWDQVNGADLEKFLDAVLAGKSRDELKEVLDDLARDIRTRAGFESFRKAVPEQNLLEEYEERRLIDWLPSIIGTHNGYLSLKDLPGDFFAESITALWNGFKSRNKPAIPATLGGFGFGQSDLYSPEQMEAFVREVVEHYHLQGKIAFSLDEPISGLFPREKERMKQWLESFISQKNIPYFSMEVFGRILKEAGLSRYAPTIDSLWRKFVAESPDPAGRDGSSFHFYTLEQTQPFKALVENKFQLNEQTLAPASQSEMRETASDRGADHYDLVKGWNSEGLLSKDTFRYKALEDLTGGQARISYKVFHSGKDFRSEIHQVAIRAFGDPLVLEGTQEELRQKGVYKLLADLNPLLVPEMRSFAENQRADAVLSKGVSLIGRGAGLMLGILTILIVWSMPRPGVIPIPVLKNVLAKPLIIMAAGAVVTLGGMLGAKAYHWMTNQEWVLRRKALNLVRQFMEYHQSPSVRGATARSEMRTSPQPQEAPFPLRSLLPASAMLAIILQMTFSGQSLDEINAPYHSEYGAYVVGNDVMTLLSRVFKVEDGAALTLQGKILIAQFIADGIDRGDPEAMIILRHEQHHLVYRKAQAFDDSRGDNLDNVSAIKDFLNQSAVDELYAYFASFVDTYGVNALSENKATAASGEGVYSLRVAQVLINQYVKGFWSPLLAKLQENERAAYQNELAVRIAAAAYTLNEALKVNHEREGNTQLTFEYLLTTDRLEQILAMPKSREWVQNILDFYSQSIAPPDSPVQTIEPDTYQALHQRYEDFKANRKTTTSKSEMRFAASVFGKSEKNSRKGNPENADRWIEMEIPEALFPQKAHVMAVFDGYQGHQLSDYLKKYTRQNFLKFLELRQGLPGNQILYEWFDDLKLETDRFLRSDESDHILNKGDIGTTASFVLQVGDQLFIATLGDSPVLILDAEGNLLYQSPRDATDDGLTKALSIRIDKAPSIPPPIKLDSGKTYYVIAASDGILRIDPEADKTEGQFTTDQLTFAAQAVSENLSSPTGPESIANALIAKATQAGRTDDKTVVARKITIPADAAYSEMRTTTLRNILAKISGTVSSWITPRDAVSSGQRQFKEGESLEDLPKGMVRDVLKLLHDEKIPAMLYGGVARDMQNPADIDILIKFPQLSSLDILRIEWLARYNLLRAGGITLYEKHVLNWNAEELQNGKDGVPGVLALHGRLQLEALSANDQDKKYFLEQADRYSVADADLGKYTGTNTSFAELQAEKFSQQNIDAFVEFRIRYERLDYVLNDLNEITRKMDDLFRQNFGGFTGSFSSHDARVGDFVFDFIGFIDTQDNNFIHGRGYLDRFFTKGAQLSFDTVAVEVDDQGFIHVHDPYSGLQDFQNGIIRFIGEGTQLFDEDVDPVQILRALRFRHQYGFSFSKKTRNTVENYFRNPQRFQTWGRFLNLTATFPPISMQWDAKKVYNLDNDPTGIGAALRVLYLNARNPQAVTEDLRRIGIEPLLRAFKLDLDQLQREAIQARSETRMQPLTLQQEAATNAIKYLRSNRGQEEFIADLAREIELNFEAEMDVTHYLQLVERSIHTLLANRFNLTVSPLTKPVHGMHALIHQGIPTGRLVMDSVSLLNPQDVSKDSVQIASFGMKGMINNFIHPDMGKHSKQLIAGSLANFIQIDASLSEMRLKADTLDEFRQQFHKWQEMHEGIQTIQLYRGDEGNERDEVDFVPVSGPFDRSVDPVELMFTPDQGQGAVMTVFLSNSEMRTQPTTISMVQQDPDAWLAVHGRRAIAELIRSELGSRLQGINLSLEFLERPKHVQNIKSHILDAVNFLNDLWRGDFFFTQNSGERYLATPHTFGFTTPAETSGEWLTDNQNRNLDHQIQSLDGIADALSTQFYELNESLQRYEKGNILEKSLLQKQSKEIESLLLQLVQGLVQTQRPASEIIGSVPGVNYIPRPADIRASSEMRRIETPEKPVKQIDLVLAGPVDIEKFDRISFIRFRKQAVRFARGGRKRIAAHFDAVRDSLSRVSTEEELMQRLNHRALSQVVRDEFGADVDAMDLDVSDFVDSIIGAAMKLLTGMGRPTEAFAAEAVTIKPQVLEIVKAMLSHPDVLTEAYFEKYQQRLEFVEHQHLVVDEDLLDRSLAALTDFDRVGILHVQGTPDEKIRGLISRSGRPDLFIMVGVQDNSLKQGQFSKRWGIELTPFFWMISRRTAVEFMGNSQAALELKNRGVEMQESVLPNFILFSDQERVQLLKLFFAVDALHRELRNMAGASFPVMTSNAFQAGISFVLALSEMRAARKVTEAAA